MQGEYLVHHRLLHGLQGNTCSIVVSLRLQGNRWSSIWDTSSPSFFSDLGVFTALSHASFPFRSLVFWPFLNLEFVLRGTNSLTDGLSFVLQRLQVGAGWNQLCLARGSPWPLLRETTAASPLPKPGHGCPMHTCTKKLLKRLETSTIILHLH